VVCQPLAVVPSVDRHGDGVGAVQLLPIQKTEQKKRDDMLKNMKRGDRVLTIGGILGTVVDVRDSEVMLKVDESSNTKIKFTRDAIKRVVEEDTAASK